MPAIASGFVYLAIILDAWSRQVVGYALGRTIEARLTLTAPEVAIATRRRPEGRVHHSDRGSQYAPERYHQSSPSTTCAARWGDAAISTKAKAESFMRPSPTICSNSSIKVYGTKRLHSALGYCSTVQFEEQQARQGVKAAA